MNRKTQWDARTEHAARMHPVAEWIKAKLNLKVINERRRKKASLIPNPRTGQYDWLPSNVTVMDAYFDDGEFDPEEFGFHLQFRISEYQGPFRLPGAREVSRDSCRAFTLYKVLVYHPELVEELKNVYHIEAWRKAIET